MNCFIDGCANPINRNGLCLRHKLLTVATNTTSLKVLREAGVTGRELARENRERFIAEKGYEPVSASERWI